MKWPFFKTEGQRIQERREEKSLYLAALKAEFLRLAVTKGFTQEQAEFMTHYLSFEGHFHEYVNLHRLPTE